MLDPVDAKHLLRYADVLSHSSDGYHRELAYTAIALLREYDSAVGLDQEMSDRVLAVAEAVLVQLGNFPGIRTLQKGVGNRYALPLSRGALRIAKEVLQRTNKGDATLTDAQFSIMEKMRGEDYFSFSGPTSLGKSFIIKDALYDIVRRDDLNDHCVVVLVPTKALISQTAADLRNLLSEVPEVNIATYPSLPKLLRQKYRRTIFVLTPERLLRYLADPVREIDYLVVTRRRRSSPRTMRAARSTTTRSLKRLVGSRRSLSSHRRALRTQSCFWNCSIKQPMVRWRSKSGRWRSIDTSSTWSLNVSTTSRR